jgi:hypothetical protein
MSQIIPNIGEVVIRYLSNGLSMKDVCCQKRIGDEQYVLYWVFAKQRFILGDKWTTKTEWSKWTQNVDH